jgi:hypothetical protein
MMKEEIEEDAEENYDNEDEGKKRKEKGKERKRKELKYDHRRGHAQRMARRALYIKAYSIKPHTMDKYNKGIIRIKE